VLKENNCQLRLLYPVKLSFIIEGEIKIIYDKQTLKEFMTTKLTLLKIVKGIPHTENKWHHENMARNNLTK
jgi:hypothetical protein